MLANVRTQKRARLIIALLVLLGWWAIQPANAQVEIDDDVTVVGSDYELNEDDTINGDLSVLGGSAKLEEGSKVTGDLSVAGGNVEVEKGAIINGDVVVLGGSLELEGIVHGDVTVFGGNVEIKDDAQINGDRFALGGTIEDKRSESAQEADNAATEGGLELDLPDAPPLPDLPYGEHYRGPSRIAKFFTRLGTTLFMTLGLGVLTLVGQLFFAERLTNIGEVAFDKPIESGGVGFLTLLIYAIISTILALLLVTICFAIASIAGYTAGGLTLVAGWVSIGSHIGKRLFGERYPDEDRKGVAAALGTAMLTLVIGLLYTISAVASGFIFPAILATILIVAFGLGAVVLTRLGTYSEASLFTPAPANAAQNNKNEHEVTHDDI